MSPRSGGSRYCTAGTIDIRFSDPDAGATPTPLIGVWHDGAMHFCTGMREQSASSLVHNDSVALTTGINTLARGTRRRRRGHGGPGHRQVGPGGGASD